MNKGPRPCRAAISIILLLVWTSFINAQQYNVNLNNLLEETQQVSEDPDYLTIVWWIPVEFWTATFAQDPTVTQSDADDVSSTLGPYTLIAVVDGRIGSFGGVTYFSEDYLRENITIKDIRGNIYRPLPKEDISPDAINLLSIMKPGLENTLGPTGKNMHFMVFSGTDANGAAVVDPLQEGVMTVAVGENTFNFRLPLGSLLPPKVCPVDGEEMNGAWKYCPWHGVELELK
jgi:hypothetical protein